MEYGYLNRVVNYHLMLRGLLWYKGSVKSGVGYLAETTSRNATASEPLVCRTGSGIDWCRQPGLAGSSTKVNPTSGALVTSKASSSRAGQRAAVSITPCVRE